MAEEMQVLEQREAELEKQYQVQRLKVEALRARTAALPEELVKPELDAKEQKRLSDEWKALKGDIALAEMLLQELGRQIGDAQRAILQAALDSAEAEYQAVCSTHRQAKEVHGQLLVDLRQFRSSIFGRRKTGEQQRLVELREKEGRARGTLELAARDRETAMFARDAARGKLEEFDRERAQRRRLESGRR